MSILSSALSNFADNNRERSAFVRDRVEQDRLYLREQGLQRKAKVQEARAGYEGVARALIRKGADEERVLGMLQLDPDGMMQVYETTKNEDISGTALNDMFTIREEYDGEATMEEILNKILPTAIAMPNDADPLTSRKNSLAAFLGTSMEYEMQHGVYDQEIIDGMTGDQILASMNLPVSAQGSSNSGVVYDFTRVSPMTASTANSLIATANTDYDDVWEAEQIAALEKSLTPEPGTEQTLTELELKAIREKIDNLKALPSGGPARLEGVLNMGYPPGATMMNLAQEYGNKLFSPSHGFNAGTAALLLGTAPENVPDTPEQAAALEPDVTVTDDGIEDGQLKDPAAPVTPAAPVAPAVDTTKYNVGSLTGVVKGAQVNRGGRNRNTRAEAEVTVANPLEAQAVIDEFFADPENKGKELLIAVEGGAIQRVDETFTSTFEAPSRTRLNPSQHEGRVPAEERGPSLIARINQWGEEIRPGIKEALGVDQPAPAPRAVDGTVRPQARPDVTKDDVVSMAEGIGDQRIAGAIRGINFGGNPASVRRDISSIVRTLRQRNQTPKVQALIETLLEIGG